MANFLEALALNYELCIYSFRGENNKNNIPIWQRNLTQQKKNIMIFPYLSPWVPACKSSLSCPTSESLRHHGCQELVTEASYQHSKLRTPQRKLRNIAILSISCENFDQDEHNIRNEQNGMTSSGSFSPVFIWFPFSESCEHGQEFNSSQLHILEGRSVWGFPGFQVKLRIP